MFNDMDNKFELHPDLQDASLEKAARRRANRLDARAEAQA